MPYNCTNYISRWQESRIRSRTPPSPSTTDILETLKKYSDIPSTTPVKQRVPLTVTLVASIPKLTRRERKRILWQKIEADKREGKITSKYYGHWELLPDLILEEIFQYLSLMEKRNSALVCYQWSRTLGCLSIWQDFTVNDSFLTMPRFNFIGQYYEDILDKIRASSVLNNLIYKARHLYFFPRKNLHAVCGFQNMMINWCHLYGPLENVESFTYVFPCDFGEKNNEIEIYGTGGSILEDTKKLLVHLTGLKELELKDLQLEDDDASHVLDEVTSGCDIQITTLKIINISRQPYQMLSVASFINLKNLFISPHNIGPEIVTCFGEMKELRNVVLVVNAFTDCPCINVDSRIWKSCRKNNPNLRIHLMTEGQRSKEVILQEGAPVKSIVYDTSYVKTSSFTLYSVVELYSADIECIAYCRLPRYNMPKSFYDRGDGAFLHLLQYCPQVHTLMIRERISSATVLLLAHTGKNLRFFHVRKNAIVLKCDWPQNPNWSPTFYNWLKSNSRSYEAIEREVSKLMGFHWNALTDKQFKLTHINLTSTYYFDGH